MSAPPTGEITDWPEEWLNANTEVFLALRGARENPAHIIAQFLRSLTPIHPLLRDALAEAFEHEQPKGGLYFEVRGLRQGPDTAGGRRRLRRDMEIAEFVESRRSTGSSRADAEAAAANHFGTSVDQAHKSVTEARKAEKWLEQNWTNHAPLRGGEDLSTLWRNIGLDKYLQHRAERTRD
ncbi:hypothetical protein HRJ34_21230 [Rhizorhabdus wittichii]|uniref:Uncharacterized protein n=1 Tax=Rhizorhabdus wittichii TaxID=160791 RepID=A0A975HCX9_9SPHN|nr:hypothetical protein [Rhizorhabdus wittichii]QTH20820.1 hypothetical protein HRJ34_21230 [Rhizorhabdus wittichii]